MAMLCRSIMLMSFLRRRANSALLIFTVLFL